MPTPTKLQPLPIALPGLRALSYGTATAIPIGLSIDRKTAYGAANASGTILYQSVDDGVTWTSVHTFPENVIGLIETDDGEALAITIGGASTPGYVYKSSGWAASHTAATWTKTLTSSGGFIRPVWGAHAFSFGDDTILASSSRVGIISEYGGSTTSSGSQATVGCHAYVSLDYGATFNLALDLSVRYPGAAGLHLHATAYDPYWDRMWATYGDTSMEAGKQGLLYSDDRGATWTAVTLDPTWGTYLQSTPIGVFEDHILLGSDNGPGFIRHERLGYRKLGAPQLLTAQSGGTSTQMIAMGIHRNRRNPGAPVLGSLVSVGTEGTVGSIVASLNGSTYAEAWRDSALVNGGLGPITVVGPTAGGVILADVLKTGSTHWQLRAEPVLPAGNQFDGIATFTGDGTTTVFTVAHGQTAAPGRLQAWTTNAAGSAFTLTADATNLIFTFATAPPVSTNPQVAYRYAAA